MFRRWAEARMYRRTVQIAVAELRRAARASDVLEKLRSLAVAEQKLEDALWLRPEKAGERFPDGLREIRRSRERTLVADALPAMDRLLAGAEKGAPEREEMLRAAGELLALLDHYLPEDERVAVLDARFRQLGGEHPSYQRIMPLSELYHRPAEGAGCMVLLCGVLVAAFVVWLAAG